MVPRTDCVYFGLLTKFYLVLSVGLERAIGVMGEEKVEKYFFWPLGISIVIVRFGNFFVEIFLVTVFSTERWGLLERRLVYSGAAGLQRVIGGYPPSRVSCW